jgi:indole-3-glycerol phosphate synthase
MDENTLARICDETRRETERRREATKPGALKAAIAKQSPPRGFYQALNAAICAGRCGLIAEMKRQSPSGGRIRDPFDPGEIAAAYEAGGATCLSVLTDAPFFGGDPLDLKAARAACSLPVLRKDFILDPWQVKESRAMGADAILLIMAALTDAQALELEEVARSLDLDVLVEVHDEAELTRALGLQTRLIGINNRDLRTLRTRIETTLELAPLVPADHLLVSESGIAGPADVHRVGRVGANAVLVGESLLRQPDLVAATRALLGSCA